MLRRQWALSLSGMLTVAMLATASPAEAGDEYFHASSCQELGNGESGAINRSIYRITNVGTDVKYVFCPIPVDSSSPGFVLVVNVNVEDHHKTDYISVEMCRRDGWGNLERNSSGNLMCTIADTRWSGDGRQTLDMQLDWIPGGSYTFTVRLPPNSRTDSTDYTRFFSYKIARY